MQHKIHPNEHGSYGQQMADAVQACVHCGFCLPTCPTYQVLGQEMDSPRGRILLMKAVLEGNLDEDKAFLHLDTCLGCLACETACPSGVPYRDLISPFRVETDSTRARTLTQNIKRRMAMLTIPHPGRFRIAARLGKLAKPLKGLVPKAIRPMIDLIPDSLPAAQPLPELTAAQGKRRAKVALLAGCVQQVIDPAIGHATLAVLSRNGVEVVVPKQQGCCGALAWHVGCGDEARKNAAASMGVFPDDVDAIITNAAGCGSGMQEYPLMFAGTPHEQRATQFAQRTQDVTTFLQGLGIETPPPLSKPMKVAYHDACHLAHAQDVRSAPRELLGMIPNLELLDLPDNELCCGSAGTYNMDQPEIAEELGQRKAQTISSLSPDIVVAGNIGCLVQIRTHMNSRPLAPRIMHTIELLNLAYQQKL